MNDNDSTDRTLRVHLSIRHQQSATVDGTTDTQSDPALVISVSYYWVVGADGSAQATTTDPVFGTSASYIQSPINAVHPGGNTTVPRRARASP